MESTKKAGDYAEKKTQRYQEQDSIKVAEYLDLISTIPKEALVYLDETGIDRYYHREYCYAQKGQPIIGQISGKRYYRTSIVAALNVGKVLSPLQYSGTMESALFETWFEEYLMRELPDHSVIVMDNAAFHRKKPLMEIAKKHGHHIMFLPPYSPELNPIEKLWAKLKKYLRKTLSQYDDFDTALMDCFKVV